MQLFDVVPWGGDYPGVSAVDAADAGQLDNRKAWKRQQQKLDKILSKAVVLPSKRTYAWASSKQATPSSTGGKKRAIPASQPATDTKKPRHAASESTDRPVKKKAKKKKHTKAPPVDEPAAACTPHATDSTDAASTPRPGSTKGSSVLAKMQQRLTGSRFRWLNEQLYTTTGDDALRLMQGQQELFAQYHDVWLVMDNACALILDADQSCVDRSCRR